MKLWVDPAKLASKSTELLQSRFDRLSELQKDKSSTSDIEAFSTFTNHWTAAAKRHRTSDSSHWFHRHDG